MRKILFLSFMLIFSWVAMAQDVLVTESGDVIQAWSVDVGGSKIYYRTSDDANAPLQSIDKSSVLVWKKADGTRVVIGHEEHEKKTENPVAKSDPVVLTADDPEANAACIQAFNQTDAFPTKTLSKKMSKLLLCLLHVTPDSKMSDKNVEISYSVYKESSAYAQEVPRTSGIGVHVRNKTDKTIYVYLGNTFFLRHGVSTPFTQSQASQSTSGGSDGTKSTGFSQNVVAIPAQSTLDLGKQEFFPNDGKNPFGGNITNNMRDTYAGGGLFTAPVKTGTVTNFYWTEPKSNLLCKGEARKLAPGQYPMDFGFKLTYSFSEDNTQLYHLDTKLYVSKVIGTFASVYLSQVTYEYVYSVSHIEFKGQSVYFMIMQKEIK